MSDRATAGPLADDLPRLPQRRVERATKKGASAARALAQYVLDNDLPPGTTLPPMKVLSEQFGIGRGTMNDALQLLEAYGLLEMRPGRYGGPVVRRPDATDLASSLTLAFYSNRSSMIDVIEARSVLEPALAQMAARRITVDQLDDLRRSVARMQDDDATMEERIAEADRFHSAVFEAAGAPVLRFLAEGLHKILVSHVRPLRFAAADQNSVAAYHTAIIEALDRRDGDAAAATWAEHTRVAEEHYKRAYPQWSESPIVWSI